MVIAALQINASSLSGSLSNQKLGKLKDRKVFWAVFQQIPSQGELHLRVNQEIENQNGIFFLLDFLCLTCSLYYKPIYCVRILSQFFNSLLRNTSNMLQEDR